MATCPRPNPEVLLDLCRRHVRDAGDVVIPEPYVPFLPETWNGFLILSEAQNLSDTYSHYVEELRAQSPEQRMRRLRVDPDGAELPSGHQGDIGVQPWDDGSLKLAVTAALGLEADETAVSNAVVWSRTTAKGNNDNPDEDVQSASVRFWKEMLEALAPEHVITVGGVARDVIRKAEWQEEKLITWRSASPTAMSRVSGMFDAADLRARYPRVARAADAHPGWLEKYAHNKLFYACHAVSLTPPDLRPPA